MFLDAKKLLPLSLGKYPVLCFHVCLGLNAVIGSVVRFGVREGQRVVKRLDVSGKVKEFPRGFYSSPCFIENLNIQLACCFYSGMLLNLYRVYAELDLQLVAPTSFSLYRVRFVQGLDLCQVPHRKRKTKMLTEKLQVDCRLKGRFVYTSTAFLCLCFFGHRTILWRRKRVIYFSAFL